MPTFPQYDSTSNINPNIQAPDRNQAAQGFDAVNNLNKTVTDIEQKWSDRNDTMQEIKRKNSAEVLLSQQEQAAQNDPNANNLESHLKAVQQIKNNLPKVDNQQVAEQTDLDIDHSSLITQLKIQSIFRDKQMLATKESQQQANIVAAKNIANAKSNAEATQDFDGNMSQIRTLHAKGIYNDAEAFSAEKEFKTEIVKARIDNNKSTSPEDYKGIDEGMGLDIKETSEMQKMVAAHIKQVEDQNILDTAKNRVSVIKSIATKQIGFQTNEQIKNLAKGDSKLQNSLQLVMDAKAEGHEYQPKEINNQETSDAISKVMQAKNVDELSDYLVDAFKDKNMTEDRMAILVNAAEKRAESLPSRGVKDISPTEASINGGYDAVDRWNKQYGNHDPQVLLDYGKSIMEGKSPQEAYKIATDSKKVKNNPSMIKYTVGQKVQNEKTGVSGEITGFNDDGAPLVKWKKPRTEPFDIAESKGRTPEEQAAMDKFQEDVVSTPGKVIGAVVDRIGHEAERFKKWEKKAVEKSADYYKKQDEKKMKNE